MYLATIEESVVDLLRGELAHPKLISLFVKAYHEERRSLDAASNTRRAFLKKRLADVSNEAERAVDLMIKGIGDPLILGAKTRELATEKVKIEEELAAIPAAENTIELHPATLRRYGEKLAALQESMANGTRDGDLSSASIMRELIESVTVRRDPDRRGGVDIVVAGKLSALLGLASFPTRVGGLVVAADRYRQTAYSNLPLYSLSSSARLSG